MSSLMIVSAALTSSVAKFPCVTTTPPISGIKLLGMESGEWGVGAFSHSPLPTPHSPLPFLLLHVPVRHPRALLAAREVLAYRVGNGDRAMLASGAAHSDGDIALSFALVERQEEIEQVAEAVDCFARLLTPVQIFDDRLIVSVQVF